MGSVNIGAIFGLDVGGTLAKIVYFEKNIEGGSTISKLRRNSRSLQDLDGPAHVAALQRLYSFMENTSSDHSILSRDTRLSFYSNILGGRLHFLHFETRQMISAIDLLASTSVTENIHTIGCTGGGAHKYAKEFAERLDITVHQTDEFTSLIRGMHFALSQVVDECYTYRQIGHTFEIIGGVKLPNPITRGKSLWQSDVKESLRKVHMSYKEFTSANFFPYMVVNIGSGVSIIKVTGPGAFERVSGTSLGGGTYWGLCMLLTRCSSYEEVLALAEKGDSSEIDMLVRDIYGGDYGNMNLSGSMVASSFGKLVMKEREKAQDGLKEEDLAIALLMMIANNIGQVAHLNAQLHGCSKIFFVGNFLRHNSIGCRRLAFAINFWSKGEMEALFLEHEGYFGAIGTFLQSAFGADVDRILTQKMSETTPPPFDAHPKTRES